MNYERIYNELVLHAQQQDIPSVKEVHHIIPRSMGGSDLPCNLVAFTPRQHFIAHRLLAKFTQGVDKYKMLKAVKFMADSSTCSREYESMRKDFLLHHKMYCSQHNGTPEGYLPLNIFSHNFNSKGSYKYLKGYNTFSFSQAGKSGQVVNFCMTLALLGYKGVTRGQGFKEYNMRLLLSEGFATEDSSGKCTLYIFTPEFYQLADKLIYTKPKGITLAQDLVLNIKGKRMPIRQPLKEYNICNVHKLLEAKLEGGVLYLRKVNAWEGTIPKELLQLMNDYNN